MTQRSTPKPELITAEIVAAAFERGTTRLSAPKGRAIITPAAWTTAQALGVELDQSAAGDDGGGRCEREVDRSGVTVVRGSSLRLGRFAPAGQGKKVGLVDVVTRAQGSPMGAGFMSFGKADAFAWRLDYDEIDYVIEGVLQLTVEGRVIEGRAGDVLSIPKGTSLIFGTPRRTRVFYVTYPADWASAAAATAPAK